MGYVKPIAEGGVLKKGQHPTGSNPFFTEKSSETASLHAHDDKFRKRFVLQEIHQKMKEKNATIESVLLRGGLSAALLDTLSHMAAPTTASDQMAHIVLNKLGDVRHSKPGDLRQDFKKRYVWLGGKQEPTPKGRTSAQALVLPWKGTANILKRQASADRLLLPPSKKAA